jgi:hypothetical protein
MRDGGSVMGTVGVSKVGPSPRESEVDIGVRCRICWSTVASGNSERRECWRAMAGDGVAAGVTWVATGKDGVVVRAR